MAIRDMSAIEGSGVRPLRRGAAVVLSLIIPGAGQCLLVAFRRGVVWAVGLAIVRVVLLFAAPVAATVWSDLLVSFGGRI